MDKSPPCGRGSRKSMTILGGNNLKGLEKVYWETSEEREIY